MGALADRQAGRQPGPNAVTQQRIERFRQILDSLDMEDRALVEGWCAMPAPTQGTNRQPGAMGTFTIVEELRAVGVSVSRGTVLAYRQHLWAQQGQTVG